MKKPCSEMFCLRNQDITDAKAFFFIFYVELRLIISISVKAGGNPLVLNGFVTISE